MASGTVAVVPARGGSKRLPRKNLLPLGGRPMIAHTLEAALGCDLFDTVVVSTDNDEIADVARSCGAEVPFIRDASLADDQTHVSAVILDALARLDEQGRAYRSVAQLMPNCPLRSAVDIADSHRNFVEGGGGLQISVTRYGWLNPWWALELADDGTVREHTPEAWTARSQDLPQLYCSTGAVWWADVERLREAGSFQAPGRRGFELPWQRAIDIDDEDDLRLAHVLFAMGSTV